MTKRQAQKDWFAIARTPTWLGRLAIALALAAVFALLGQWQLGRALPASTAKPLASQSGQGAAANLKTFTLKVDDANVEIISGRLQPSQGNGFWLISNSTVLASDSSGDVGKELTVAWGWAPTFEKAVAAHVKFQAADPAKKPLKVSGVLADSEGPLPEHPAQPFLFDSLSLGQLINAYQPIKVRHVMSQFLIAQPAHGTTAIAALDAIVLAAAPSGALDNVNWLSAFYAIEWTVFAGFAVFMWWRLVEDERLRRKAEAEAAAELERLRLEAEAAAAAKAERAKAKAKAAAKARAAAKAKQKAEAAKSDASDSAEP